MITHTLLCDEHMMLVPALTCNENIIIVHNSYCDKHMTLTFQLSDFPTFYYCNHAFLTFILFFTLAILIFKAFYREQFLQFLVFLRTFLCYPHI